ncbi:MAG: heavy metal-binding domain-containing protein, partial [Betaproteobacteria bacterium]
MVDHLDKHGGHDHSGHGPGNVTPLPAHDHAKCPHGGANAGALKDPVCGMAVTSQSKHHLEHAGTTYFFCSAGCRTKFAADPAHYLQPAAAPVAEARAGAQYTCPMHPEIVRDKPGDCPICGMALVPIAGTGEADDSELRDLKRRLWLGTALSIPLVVLAMSPMVGIHDLFGLQPRMLGWIQFVLGTPVVLWVGWP